MSRRRVASIYDEYVVTHGLERSELLASVRERCSGSPTVLYPGCFVHVTPSFYFQHVVYVDTSDFAGSFFDQTEDVLDLVRARRTYPQQPYVRFLRQDFTQQLPLRLNSFDVLIALYTSDVSCACRRYVKPGGVILSDNHHGDAEQAATFPDLELLAVAERQRNKLCFRERAPGAAVSDFAQAPLGHDERGARYFLFRKRTLGSSNKPIVGGGSESETVAGTNRDIQSTAAEDSDDVAVLEITNHIDLHGFRPREIPSVVESYLHAARAKGFTEVRLIHGRGVGVQRARVQSLLARLPYVIEFGNAPAWLGGWGATVVRMLPLQDDESGPDP